MGGKGKAPAPPDMTAMAEASLDIAKMWEQVSRDQLDWAKEMGDKGMQLLDDILGPQKEQLLFALDNARKDRQRYEDTFQPIEDDLVKEFMEYDTPERREQQAAKQMADTRAAYEAQRNNAEQNLSGLGIDPSQIRSNALDKNIRAQEAAMTAASGQRGRDQVEQMGRALRGEAINIGRGMPSQVAQSQGIVNQTAGGMTGNFGGITGATSGAYGGAMQAGQMGMQGYQQGANIQNQGYQNQLSQWNANAQASSSMWGGIGELAGTGLMAYSMGGGSFPSDPKLKKDRKPVGKSAAKAIADSPAETWNYKDGTGLGNERHIGPMADDVQRELGVGNGQAIPMQDLLGAHHAAIGELTEKLERGGQVGDSYVIPKPVLGKKGTEFFDKLLKQYAEDA